VSELPIIDELRADLLVAMRAAETPARMRMRPLRPVLLASLALALLAATAAAATYYVLRASPIAPFKPTDTTPEQRVAPGTSHVLELRAADPDAGAPPWALRIARSQTGLLCGTVGQVQDDEFGIVGLDGRFRALPEANADACSAPDRDGLALLGARVFDADRPAEVRSVIYGVAGRGLTAASVTLSGSGPRQLRVGRDGAFLWAVRGRPRKALVRLRFASGRTRALSLDVRPRGGLGP
jgi:hypothetical protein